MSAPIRISAVGDISFEGPMAGRPSADCMRDLTETFGDSDLVIGNMECVLVEGGESLPGKCTLHGSPRWAETMKSAGIGFVSLANNHIMDYGPDGLFSTIDALSRAGIRSVGAGKNQREACAPLVLEVGGRSVALLGRSAVVVNGPVYAGDDTPGVAFLDLEELAGTIRNCRSEADLVVVLVHWGLEEYLYPSPAQRTQARQLAEAGADIVLGHHPHVVQGVERHKSAVVAYSLGNFTFSEFEWSYPISETEDVKQLLSLSEENRKGLMATIEWTDRDAATLQLIPTRINADGRVTVDKAPPRQAEIDLRSRRLHRYGYRLWWRIYAMRREWGLRLGSQLSARRVIMNLHRLRPRHVKELFGSLRRSMGIVSEKTTNPYD